MTQNLQPFLTAARLGQIQQVTEMTWGLSGAAVYGVTTQAGEFILRLNVTPRNNDGFAHGLRAQRLAAEQGLAPQVFYADPGAGVGGKTMISATSNFYLQPSFIE